MKEDKKDNFIYEIYLLPKSFDLDQLIETVRTRKNTNISLQLIDPKWVVNEKHLLAAVYHTQKAFANNRNLARDKATEFLIRVSGQSQIKNALKVFGIQKESKHLLIIAFGGSTAENKEEISSFIQKINIPLKTQKDKLLPITNIESLSDFYNIKQDSIDLEKVVLERIASVEIY